VYANGLPQSPETALPASSRSPTSATPVPARVPLALPPASTTMDAALLAGKTKRANPVRAVAVSSTAIPSSRITL
jgi:hypothetical protein